ncbi:Crp/Fnr family transcriptional regulator [Brevibacillus daliensis]|uniref:Crp/Fnr family transcriptional regulator n=1 Tax=Brevibacillus daliensis TaxID=2892995 RepID=UPI001E5F045F|nr:Crp/Fnr family transcriptional regulator [Brevibacillus daliensis]
MNQQKYAWEPYLSKGVKKLYKPKATLFRQGDVGTGFYYLADGEVKIMLVSKKGDERTIDIIYPGELVGEAGIKKEPFFSSAFVTKPSTLFYFSNEAFHSLCQEHSQAIDIFLSSLIKKQRLLAEIVSQENRSCEQKLAFFLLRLYQKNANPKIVINQITLSNYIGKSRITVYKILRQWEQADIVTVSNRTIVINDIERLHSFLRES